MIVDLFAGGGGASVGIEAATGRIVDLAINHSPIALAVHEANHPKTRHLVADIWDVKPAAAVGRRKVELLWASPDCTHFSVAKGGKPREHGTRSLAWVVVDWARVVRPAVICLENVREFLGWGPLDSAGNPIKARMGETFAQWRGALELLGYVVDHRILDASLYGAPTRRRRLFLVARCDGLPIRWPEPTHGPGKAPLRTAAECIDWSIPCPSIFDRKKPLAEKTLWRIAQGIRRFVLEHPSPFIVEVNHGKLEPRVNSLDQPITTVTASRRSHALVAPVIAGVGGRAGQSAATGGEQPIGTITAKNDRVLIAPTLVQTGYGERPAIGAAAAQRPRYLDLHAPMGTLMAEGVKQALVSAFLVKHFGDPQRSAGGGVVLGQELDHPQPTITTRDHSSLAMVRLAESTSNYVAEARAFLTAYYGDSTGQSLSSPLRTITTMPRFGLVTVAGVEYQIADIGMRMLEPHELLAAQFGRFAAGYDLSAAKTKAAKVRLIGNSVCPEVAEAVVRANWIRCAKTRAA